MTAPLKADVTAADRLLKAAVRRAIREMRNGNRWRSVNPPAGYDTASVWTPYDPERVVAMLATAGHAADLLLSEPTS